MPVREVRLAWPAADTVVAGPDTWLVVPAGGSLHVVPGRCPHRGGPLHLGSRTPTRVQCPWHGTWVPMTGLLAGAAPAVTVGGVTTAYLRCDDDALVDARRTIHRGPDHPVPTTERRGRP